MLIQPNLQAETHLPQPLQSALSITAQPFSSLTAPLPQARTHCPQPMQLFAHAFRFAAPRSGLEQSTAGLPPITESDMICFGQAETHLPQPIQRPVSICASPDATDIACSGQTAAQSPIPMQPYAHPESEPNSAETEAQESIPEEPTRAGAFSAPPPQCRTATLRTKLLSTPSSLLISPATSAPPATQRFVFSPFSDIADAYAAQPEYPHPPQFAPGRSDSMAEAFLSTGTPKSLEAMTSPTAATMPRTLVPWKICCWPCSCWWLF